MRFRKTFMFTIEKHGFSNMKLNRLNQKYFFCFLIFILPFGFFTNQDMIYAEEVIIPDWVWDVYFYWKDNIITDAELVNAIIFLEEKNIVDLILHREYDTKTNFLLSILEMEKHDSLHELTSCSSDWYITGYFIPVESDYTGKFSKIMVDNEIREFKVDFVDAIKIEGWGKTLSNDYLGWYDNSFHLSDTALDSFGEPLSVSSVAVDSSIIEENIDLIIPSLPAPWDILVFTANDEGPAIKDKHIDVFVGEGKIAQEESYRITGYENEVCIGEYQ